MAAPRALQAVVFDFDGVLLDTAGVWDAAYADVLRPHRAALSDARRTALVGASVGQAAASLNDQLGGGDGRRAALEAVLEERLAAHLPHRARELPDARRLVRRLEGRQRLAVASNAPAWFVRAALGATGLMDAFELVLGAEPDRRPKPAPDTYLRACELLDVDAKRAAAIEDSPAGAAAALAAGMYVILRPVVPVASSDADLVVEALDDSAVLAVLGLSS